MDEPQFRPGEGEEECIWIGWGLSGFGRGRLGTVSFGGVVVGVEVREEGELR